ncbi:hypothetical protein [Aeromonas rivipollensis]|uniref:hypothetical protein n=1 Tax=Aeromonas rivipollensis TaxID=948519 RepID=UPI0038D20FA6
MLIVEQQTVVVVETRRSVVLDVHLLQGDDRLGAILDAEFAEVWARRVTRISVVLDIHLLQSDDRLGAILDAEFAEGGSDMGPEGDKALSCP